MRKILFVDDEQKVLDGLRRLLHPFRSEWETHFAPGGQEALELLAKTPFDVVVSDIRMPEMDGVQLLSSVRTRYPQTVRIILSGQCEQDAALRAIRIAHRQLTKPCAAETVRATIRQACALRGKLTDPALLALVSRQITIPSLPTLYLEVTRELEAREPSVQKVGALIAKDIGMTAKILQVTNSSFFGLRRTILNPTQAVLVLGLETIQSLVLAASIFSKLEPALVEPLSLESLWIHSQHTAALAGRIATAEKADKTGVEYATVAGLLHDTGKLLLASSLPDQYREVVERAIKEGRVLADVERETFGAGHAEVGAYLLGLWGLPDPVVEAVAWHHAPTECPGSTFSPLTAVHSANVILNQAMENSGARIGLCQPDETYFRQLGVIDRFPVWRRLLDTQGTGGGDG